MGWRAASRSAQATAEASPQPTTRSSGRSVVRPRRAPLPTPARSNPPPPTPHPPRPPVMGSHPSPLRCNNTCAVRLVKSQSGVCDGGGDGIRTHGSVNSGGFQDRCLRPLGHPSSGGLKHTISGRSCSRRRSKGEDPGVGCIPLCSGQRRRRPEGTNLSVTAAGVDGEPARRYR